MDVWISCVVPWMCRTYMLLRARVLSRQTVTAFSIRAMANTASSSRYGFLAELGLSAEQPGVFDGSWYGSGELNNQVSIQEAVPMLLILLLTPPDALG